MTTRPCAADAGTQVRYGQGAAARATIVETGWKARGRGHLVAGFQPVPGMVDTPHEVFVHDAEQIGEPTDAERQL